MNRIVSTDDANGGIFTLDGLYENKEGLVENAERSLRVSGPVFETTIALSLNAPETIVGNAIVLDAKE
jgi:hypothetical protein